MENNLKSRKKKDRLLISLVYLSAIITVGLLLVIVGFIFIKGIGKINLSFYLLITQLVEMAEFYQ